MTKAVQGFQWLVKTLFRAFTLMTVFFVVNGCDGWIGSNQSINEDSNFETSADLQYIQKKPLAKILRVATVINPFSYQKIQRYEFGLEQDLLKNFARMYSYELEFLVVKNEWDVVTALQNKSVDVAMGRLPEHWLIRGSMFSSPSYDEHVLSLLCDKDSLVELDENQKLVSDIALKFATHRKYMGSNARESFRKKYTRSQLIDLWNSSPSDLAQMVANKKADCAILESNEAKFLSRGSGKFLVYQLNQTSQDFHFFIGAHREDLIEKFQKWFQFVSRKGELARIKYTYTGHLDSLSTLDLKKLRSKISSDLPKFRKIFLNSADEFEVPWRLLAAVAYQESHWNSEAVSHTGVRGFMQITEQTAEHLGLEDHLDVQANIQAASKYLKALYQDSSALLSDRERWIHSLIAYNVGPAHLQELLHLAEGHGLKSNWMDLRRLLMWIKNRELLDSPIKDEKADEVINFVERVLSFSEVIK